MLPLCEAVISARGSAIAALLVAILGAHLTYLVLLRQMKRCGLSVDTKSPGMGFEKNLKIYFRARRDGVLKGTATVWMLFLWIAGTLCSVVYLLVTQ